MRRKLIALIWILNGLATIAFFDAFGAEIGPFPLDPLSAKDLTEMKAHLEMQKTGQDMLRTYRYLECVDGDKIQKSVDAYNAKASPSLSHAVASQLNEGWSVTVGTAASLKLFSYDLGTKKGAVADGAGLGVPIRFYNGNIHAVKDKCRPRSYRMTSIENDPLAGAIGNHLFSITPTIYFTKTANANDNDVAIKPALVLSFLNDMLHFGAGFNLSGQNQGNAFLVFGIGTQLPGETH